MKKCFKCSITKPLTEFYKHPMMTDGTVNKCKECNKKDIRCNRSNNLEEHRKRNRDYARTHKDSRIRHIISNKLHPEKYKARTALNNAVRSGRIKRLKYCEGCGDSKRRVEGHHQDYSKAFDVVWLCSVCHSFTHKIRLATP